MENRIKKAAAGVETNVRRFIALDKGSEEVAQQLEAFEREEVPLARETTLAFLGGSLLFALLVAAATWLLLREPAPSETAPPADAAEERAAAARPHAPRHITDGLSI